MPTRQEQGDERRAAILDYIRAYMALNGFAPTLREIAEGVGLASLNSTRNHLNTLVDQGAISLVPGVGRTITLLEPAPH